MLKTLGCLLLLIPLALGGCADKDDGKEEGTSAPQQIAADRKAVDAATAALVPALMERLRVRFLSGTASYATCGTPPELSGVAASSRPQFHASPLNRARAAAKVREILQTEGWEIEESDVTHAVAAQRDKISFQIELGTGGTVVHISSECVDTSKDVAEEYGDKPAVDIPAP